MDSIFNHVSHNNYEHPVWKESSLCSNGSWWLWIRSRTMSMVRKSDQTKNGSTRFWLQAYYINLNTDVLSSDRCKFKINNTHADVPSFCSKIPRVLAFSPSQEIPFNICKNPFQNYPKHAKSIIILNLLV